LRQSQNGVALIQNQKSDIIGAVKTTSTHGWYIESNNKFFCVDKFFKTSFVKSSKFPMQDTRLFDMKKITNGADINNAEELVLVQKNLDWQSNIDLPPQMLHR